MINPQEIKLKANRKYKSYLQAYVSKQAFFPLRITGNKRPSKSLATFHQEITSLVQQSKEAKGYGYHIEFKEVKTKALGTQNLPANILFETEYDYLKFIQKQQEVKQFKADIQHIYEAFPKLIEWAKLRPQKVIQNAQQWPEILKVLHYFKGHPQPNCYIRELPIQVHTKFVETHKGILRELLDIVIADFVNAAENQFEKRFHLRYAAPLIRFKILDQNISNTYLQGCNDLSIPLHQFESLQLPIQQVLIVENKTTLYTTLTLPTMSQTIAIFGRGYGVANLKNVSWLHHTHLYYWGDLDAQGFEILSQLRYYFPHTQSLLMDRATFQQFFENDSGTPSKLMHPPQYLHSEEYELYELLKQNNWRLEQEKIPLEYVKGAIERSMI